MNKRVLLEKLVKELEHERAALVEAALNTYEAATHEESEAEDQYDTRGLEASYLAGAQSKRVAEVEQTLHTLRHLELKNFAPEDAIAEGALVELEGEDRTNYVLLLRFGGGLKVELDGHTVQVITPKSPLGEAIVGRQVGDVVVIDVGRNSHEYEIVSVK